VPVETCQVQHWPEGGGGGGAILQPAARTDGMSTGNGQPAQSCTAREALKRE
jgi:hypothetical protein